MFRPAFIALMMMALMLWPRASAYGAADPTISAGKEHFLEFEAACLRTKGQLDAVKEHARLRGWGAGMIQQIPTGGTTAGWGYTKGGRHFAVRILADWPMPWGEKDVQGRPFSSCVVSTSPSADLTAMGSLRNYLNAPGCEEQPAEPGTRVRWPMSGEDYKVIYYFRRNPDPEGTRDELTLERLGTSAADKALAAPYVQAACAPP